MVAGSFSRRGLLRLGALAPLAALAACDGGDAGDASRTTAWWCWPGGFSENVITDAVTAFADRTALTTSILTGDYLDQLLPVLAAGNGVPAIAGVKGEDIAAVLPRAAQFVDLNELGAHDVAGEFLSWKMRQGSTIDGHQVGLPIDIGPTAMFYRTDLFAEAGLPAEPDAVSRAMPTWKAYFDAGETLRAALPKVRLVRNAAEVFSTAVGQSEQRFVDESNHFVGDGDHVRLAWDLAVELVDRDLSAAIPTDDEDGWKAAMAAGRLATELGAAWRSADVELAVPDQAGKWRVAEGPAGGASTGGSFLTIPAAGSGHELSFEIIRWLLTPENQARNFTDAALFPAAPAAYQLPALTGADPFFGGQVTVGVFAGSAKKAPRAYEAPSDTALAEIFLQQLGEVDAGATSSGRGWSEAVEAARNLATQQGVN
ncbi:extracellular solute-binding protein [Actinoplanes sp. NPDC051494]|uniref:extracellular solute-binding protein n=1 Tax=Actinoplanes sp. NPDC051494 TaxID=3363907 RepID=UPI00378D4A24